MQRVPPALVFALVLAAHPLPAKADEAQKRAVAALKKLGASIHHDPDKPEVVRYVLDTL